MFVAYYLCFTIAYPLCASEGRKGVPKRPIMYMRQKVFLLILLCALLVGILGVAQAYDPIAVTMDLSKNEFTGPGDVTVSIKVSNVGDDRMPGPVYLFYPDGKTVSDFGDGGAVTLDIGVFRTWTGTWRVTQKQLEDGKITFGVKYPVPNEDGSDLVWKNKYFNKAIIYKGAVPGLEVTRTLSAQMARKDQKVTVTYDLTNTGNVALTNITLTENKSISTKKATIKSLPANSSQKVSFEVTMGDKNLTSSATVTYKATGSNETLKKTIEAQTITLGEANLSAKLASSAAGVNIGDKVKLTLTLKNQGTISYSNVKVTDPGLGDIDSNLELAAGETKTIEKEVTLMASAEYAFTVQATDNTGSEVSITTDKVSVGAVDPNKKLELTVNASADRLEVYTEPAQVRFEVAVTNASESDASNVTLRHGSTTIYTFPTIKAGETKKIQRDTSISVAGTFRFTATCKDLLGNDVSFESNPISISFAVQTPEPTTVPQRTPAPLVTEKIPTSAGLPPAFATAKSVSMILFALFLVLTAGSVLLIAVAFAKRLAQKRQSDAALDHLERGTRRDYTAPSENDADAVEYREDGEEQDGSQQEPVFSVEEDELPHMKYVRSDQTQDGGNTFDDEQQEDDPPQAEENYRELSEEEAAILSGGTGHYRLPRTAKPAVEDEPTLSAAGFARRRRTARNEGSEKAIDS